ncbi:hypothetical protein [Streptomyces sp. NPDC057702]|uniref:hypothetical protein n=1 Tax=unclassified Streptomyces TaxID=2593676 RepID=UPI0036A2E2DC
MGSLSRVVSCAVAVALAALPVVPSGVVPLASAHAAGSGGRPSSFTIEDDRITESSGLAASRAHPGVYWTHNDSDDGPFVYAVDSETGRTVATVTLRGIGDPRDVEAVSVGPDGRVYVADIGDNLGGTWPKVWIYAFPEPKRLADITVTATQYTVQYEGGPRDAEAMMVHPKTGRVYIVSKREEGGGLYAGPARLAATGVNRFERIGEVGMWVTDGAFSPDGAHLVLRGYFEAVLFDWRGGKPKKIGEPRLPIQRQGESVTYSPDGGTLMYGTEGRHSRVTAVHLEDDQLSPQARRQQGADKAAGGGKGSSDGDETNDSGNYYLVGVLLAVCAAVGLAGRRLFRRR